MALSVFKSELTRKRGWLLGGYDSLYQLNIPLATHSHIAILDFLSNHLLPLVTRVEQDFEILNFKGRDSAQVAPKAIGKIAPRNNELLTVNLELLNPDSSRTNEELDANYSLTTTYLGTNSGKIKHALKIERSSDLPAGLSAAHLCRLVPAQVKQFRFGVNEFRNSFVGASLGYSPSIFRSFLIDANEGNLTLQLKEEKQRSLNDLPWGDSPILQQAHVMLLRICDFPLIEELQNKIKN